jgi:hypothetical protein
LPNFAKLQKMASSTNYDLRKTTKLKMNNEYSNCLTKSSLRKYGVKLEYFKNNKSLQQEFVNFWEGKYWNDLMHMEKINLYRVSVSIK